MLFNSVQFLIFLPLVLAVFYLIPQKIRYIWLLIVSYYFYMCWNVSYILLILLSTVVTYFCGLGIQWAKNLDSKKCYLAKRLCIILSCILNLSVLFFFKYFNFVIDNLGSLLAVIGIQLNRPQFDVLLPVGISFYTFQAIGYTIDVYRDEIYAEKNFFRYALFVSFFPQLVAGPIERSRNLLKQLSKTACWNGKDVKEGVLLMLWGFFLKVVIADRIAIFVNTVYGNVAEYTGVYFVIATLLFAIQIYCDFSGYSIIAMGSAKLLGIDLMVNFDAPYFSMSVHEFWKRWHISLSSWFRDYLYIPLGGNRKGRLRRYINILITFTISGLWHGAQWTYVAWGMLNGFYQIAGDLLYPVRNYILKGLGVHTKSFAHKGVRIVGTFCLVSFSWIFFRAGGIREALTIIKSIFTVYNIWILFDGSLFNCGIEPGNWYMLLISITILFFADLARYKGFEIRKAIMKQDDWFQVFLIAFSVVSILLFGTYGPGFDAESFIYFQF